MARETFKGYSFCLEELKHYVTENMNQDVASSWSSFGDKVCEVCQATFLVVFYVQHCLYDSAVCCLLKRLMFNS